MAEYDFVVNLPQKTLDILQSNKYTLLMFKGVKGPTPMVNTVWYTIAPAKLALTNPIAWNSPYSGYVTQSVPNNEATITASANSQAPMKAGDLATVDASGKLTLATGNSPGLQISNTTTKQIYCGLLSNNPSTPSLPATICCAALYGNFTACLEPLEKVYLCFSQTNSNAMINVVWTFTTYPGYVVDLTDPSMKGVVVNYDINKGWSCPNTGQAMNCVTVAQEKDFTFLNAVN